MDDLAISIINYRTGDMTIAAAASVLVALGDRPARVVVVDNASGDGSDREIEAWMAANGDPRLHLVRSATNSGFSGGHNQGMAAAPGADFYLILNSDALLRPDFFDALLPEPDRHPQTGLFAPQLEWEDGTPQISCFRFASPVSELLRGAQTGPVTKLFARHVTALELPTGEDPGGLNLTDLAEDRRQASEDALLLDAGQEVAQGALPVLAQHLDVPRRQLAMVGHAHRHGQHRIQRIGIGSGTAQLQRWDGSTRCQIVTQGFHP